MAKWTRRVSCIKVLSIIHLIGFVYSQQEYDVRLANKQTTTKMVAGRIEVYHNKQWGTICDDMWSEPDAVVVCGMMGYATSNAEALQAELTKGRWVPPFGHGTGVIWLHDVGCIQGVKHLSRCEHAAWNSSRECTHAEDAGVRCEVNTPGTKTTPPTTTTTKGPVIDPSNCVVNRNPEVRIISVSGSPRGVGLLEVLNKQTNTWGQMCDNDWSVGDAKVVCRMLCFDPKVALPGANSAYVGQPSPGTSIHLARLGCTGTEAKIDQCPLIEWSSGGCSQGEEATVTCKQPDLTPGPAPEPRLKCDDKWMTATFSRLTDKNLRPQDISADNCSTNVAAVYVNKDRDVAITVPYDDCNTRSESNDTDIIHSTRVFYSSRLDPSSEVRRQTYIYNLHCVFPRNGTVDRGPVLPHPQTVDVTGSGRYHFTMHIYTDSTFTTPVTEFPWNVTLGEWLNVGVVLQNQYTGVKLVVDSCRATPTRQANPSYPIIDRKCPNGDTTLFPRDRTTFTFNFKTFKFAGPNDQLYIECDAIVCEISETDADCDQSCRKRVGVDAPWWVIGFTPSIRAVPYRSYPRMLHGVCLSQK